MGKATRLPFISSVDDARSTRTSAPGLSSSQRWLAASTMMGIRPFFSELLRKISAIAVLTPFAARGTHHLVEPFGLGLTLDVGGARHDEQAHALRHVPAAQDPGGL